MPYPDFAALGGRPVELYHFALGTSHWFWTSSEEPVTITVAPLNALSGGTSVTFEPVVLSRAKIAADDEAKSQTVVVTLARDNVIARLFAVGGPPSPLSVTLYAWQRDDTGGTVTYATLFAGQAKNAKFTDTDCEIECGPYQSLVQRQLLQVLYQPTCNNTLFGVRCALSAAGFTHSGTFNAIDSTHLQMDPTLTALFASDVATYGHGRLTGGFVSVAAYGSTDRQAIIAQDCDTGIVTLMHELVTDVTSAASTAADFIEGCDKTSAICKSQFDNFVNFQGFEFVPVRNPFTSAVV